MESLKKYVPFIDFILKVDTQKYIKFTNIKKWIVQKKNYPLSDLNKIEQSIITQYKNLLLDNVKIPESITNIFVPMNINQFVNLCSDDEEDEIAHKKDKNGDSSKKNSSKALEKEDRPSSTSRIHSKMKIDDDSDDDLEIVSTYYVNKVYKKIERKSSKDTNTSKVSAVAPKEELEIDPVSKEVFNKIDKFAEDDRKMKSSLHHDPIIYTYKKDDHVSATFDEETIYQRRANAADSDSLYKRRTDFNEDKVEVQCLGNQFERMLHTKEQIQTISIDSDSDDDEACNADRDSPTTYVVTLNTTDNAEMEEMEVAVVDDTAKNVSDKPRLDNKEKTNTVQPICENVGKTGNTPDLNPEQISKVLEDISSKTDLEIETLYEALAYVRQMNNSSTNNSFPELSITPPPDPPPVSNNFPAPPVQPDYPPQQNTLSQTFNPNYYQNSNVVPVADARPKVNINDPRIKKQLQAIQNSPLFKYNVLNPAVEESIRKICAAQQMQQTQSQPLTEFQTSAYPNKKNVPCCKTSRNTYKSSINYGEYKRRQLEKNIESEMRIAKERMLAEEAQREKERLAEVEAQRAQREKERLAEEEAQRAQREKKRLAEEEAQKAREIEKLELSKKENEIRSIILSALKPSKEQIITLWNQQKNLEHSSCTNSRSEIEQENENSNEMATANANIFDERTKTGKEKKQDALSTKDSKQLQNKKVDGNSSQNTKIANKKMNRIYSELNCTVIGFNQFQDYIPNESSKSLEDDENAQTKELTHRPVGLKRRSSIHALSAITKQLGQQSSDCSDSDINQNTNSSQNSYDNLPQCSISKRRKTIDEVIRPTRRAKKLRIVDDDFSSSEASDDEVINKINKEPVIKLHRLTKDDIRKHTERSKENKEAQNHVSDLNSKTKRTCEKAQKQKAPSQKKSKLKKYNNDCQMTERNTVVCVLCRSKPSDLTNHYISRHKTESYIARFEWSELDDLTINTPFAKLQPKTKNCRYDRYEVECPFCKEKMINQFMNLYDHYSAHTGEYAYQCSHCQFSKPYRADIQSHILHSKTCRRSSVQIMYRYPPHTQCIYLHYCTICTFVQLNEANVLKHLREQHSPSQLTANNVQKCILAAMSDGPDTNERNTSPSSHVQQDKVCTVSSTVVPGEKTETPVTEINFKVDDDDVPVGNEPCLDEEFMEEEKYTIEETLKQLHREPVTTNTAPPMTVIHSISNNMNNSPATASVTNLYPTEAQKHEPIILKTEDMDVRNNTAQTQTQCTTLISRKYTVYERYRSYPENVNYLGLYKCMIDDCYYSTDCSEEICKHLMEHYSAELKPSEYLQCPYCVIPNNMIMSPTELVEHVNNQHGHLNYQCSICCYRSCDASNVLVHQKVHHNSVLNTGKIYKCSSDDFNVNNKQKLDLDTQIAMNVSKISCKICCIGFYRAQLLTTHLEKEHKLNVCDIEIYSCIYCPDALGNRNQIRIHVATQHPTELPLVYDHNKHMNLLTNEDSKSIENVDNLSESVECVEFKATACTIPEEKLSQDVKPDINELLLMNEEVVRVRLQKLTAHTGVQPDKLYRCPEQKCGGFFSIFDLWIRHMKVKHCSLECQCPHCQPEILLPLEQFALHFEQHRRHTFICFYCSVTSQTELLARQHTTDMHSDMGEMRFEKVRFNLSCSYSIAIHCELFKEREQFIAELLAIVDNRLKDLENDETKKLKHQWLVRDNTPWIVDCMHDLSNRKVARRCLVKDCSFRTFKADNLYHHINTLHSIEDTQFNCSKCDFHVEKCKNLDEIFNHINLHSEFGFICGACSISTSSRSKMSAHIRKQHLARDVPVVHVFRNVNEIYVKIYIVFSENYMTFSTMKNCFCCSERNMGGDLFTLHLKRYHKLSLNYSCEKCPNYSLKSLNEVVPHFQQVHNTSNYKIRCELASHNELCVTSLNDFQVQILKPHLTPEQTSSQLQIKTEVSEESDGDNVIPLEDDDIVIQNCLREERLLATRVLPKLKCAPLSKLLKPPAHTPTPPSLSSPLIFPSNYPSNSLGVEQMQTQELKGASFLPTTSKYNQLYILPNAVDSGQFPTTSSLAAASATRQNINNLSQFTTDMNISTINPPHPPFNSVSSVYNSAIITSNQHSLPSDPHYPPTNVYEYNQHMPNILYRNSQTYGMQLPVCNIIPTDNTFLISQNYDDIRMQNTKNNC